MPSLLCDNIKKILMNKYSYNFVSIYVKYFYVIILKKLLTV